MKGEWIMIRLKPRGREKGENWLLRKVADEHAGGSDDLVTTHLTGVESGLTMAEIAAGKKPTKTRASATKAEPPAASATEPARRTSKAKLEGVAPPFRPVQLATLVDHVPAGNAWLHEMKYDGYRTLISIGGGDGRAALRGMRLSLACGNAQFVRTGRRR